MKLINEGAEIFVPDGKPAGEALKRTTHMGISAHQDDIEIMAYDGILKCFGRDDRWFLGVVVTNGAGSPRDDLYASYTDEQMRLVRKKEQKKAAFAGEYTAAVLLDYTSSAVKDPGNRDVVEEIKKLVEVARPEVIYTHNLADKHDTHVATAIKVIKALGELPGDVRPGKLYGCEVWRGLDWVNDDEKVMFDVSGHPNIAAALVEVYDSQVCGGKRYDLATAGRRLANATYAASHGVDVASAITYAMDLTPLIEDESIDICKYVTDYIERFKNDVSKRIIALTKAD
ncbi:MAG: PIG-L family deacetylase [Clostridiaceae bacterium]|nr:PIG-L family deacetylase [Clostridiaceae bacterium]